MNFLKILILSFLCLTVTAQSSDIYALFSPHDGPKAFDIMNSKISTAKTKVYITIYSWSDSSFKKSLTTASIGGADVKVILHPSLSKKSRIIKYVQELEESGVEVKIAKMNMHEKFIIIDDIFLINSSANLSGGAKSRYSENFIFHNDKTSLGKSLLKQFNDEFSILWNSAKDIKTNDEPNSPSLKIVDVDNLPDTDTDISYFLSSSMNYVMKDNKPTSRDYTLGRYIGLSRKGGSKNQTWIIRDTIISHINDAKTNIYLSINHMNIRAISDALIEAVKRGVDVKLTVDNQEYKNQPNNKEMSPQFVSDWKKIKGNKSKEAPVRVKYYSHSPSPRHWFLNHHKFIIFDYDKDDASQTTLISGSYNLSKTAEHNQFDNMVVYKGSEMKELYSSFKNEFDNLWGLNRTSKDVPNQDLYQKMVTPYRDSIVLHSDESISLKWSEVKSLRKEVEKLAPGIFKEAYKHRDCMYYSIVKSNFWACPSK